MQDYSQLERFGVHYCHPTPIYWSGKSGKGSVVGNSAFFLWYDLMARSHWMYPQLTSLDFSSVLKELRRVLMELNCGGHLSSTWNGLWMG